MDIKIIGTKDCRGCSELKEHMDSIYPDTKYTYHDFKDINKDLRLVIREYLNTYSKTLPVILVNNDIFTKTRIDFFNLIEGINC